MRFAEKLSHMSKEQIIAEVVFLEMCQREMPDKETAYDISVGKNYLSLFSHHGSIAESLKALRNTMNAHPSFFPQSDEEKNEEQELFSLIEML